MPGMISIKALKECTFYFTIHGYMHVFCIVIASDFNLIPPISKCDPFSISANDSCNNHLNIICTAIDDNSLHPWVPAVDQHFNRI